MKPRRGVKGQECIYVYVEAASNLASSYATNDVMPLAFAKTDTFYERLGKTNVSFAYAFNSKTLR